MLVTNYFLFPKTPEYNKVIHNRAYNYHLSVEWGSLGSLNWFLREVVLRRPSINDFVKLCLRILVAQNCIDQDVVVQIIKN